MLPDYDDGIDYSFQIDAINHLAYHLDLYYFFSDDNMVLMAKRKPQIYKYPSGKEIKYSILTNEISANMPIYLPAMGNSMKKYEIVIRENSLNYLTAKAMSEKIKIPILSIANQEKTIKNKLLGVMISHEHAEHSIPEEERINQKQIIVELIAEIKSVEFMKMNNFSLKNYEFFHKLREKRKYLDNFSGLIARNNYDPKLAYIQVSSMLDK